MTTTADRRPERTDEEPGRQRRVDVLDVLRGIAILGTLGTNVWAFADPGGPGSGALNPPSPGTGAEWFEVLVRWVFNGKALAVLTLLFGIGLCMQYEAAQRRGVRWPRGYLRRPAVLFAEGLLHYVLVFEWDVLTGYAIAALVAASVLRHRRTRRVVCALSVAIHVAFVAQLTVYRIREPLSAGMLPAWSGDDYGAQVLGRLDNAAVYRAELPLLLPMSVAMFLCGAALWRAGALADTAAGARLRRRLMVLGLGVALPVNLALGVAGGAGMFVERYLAAPLVGVGVIAAVASLLHRRARRAGAAASPHPLRRSLAAVGRTALSCYVLQNVLASALCYGWGLNLAERLDAASPWYVPALWLAVCAANVVAARWWLRRFGSGPAEMLSRRLTDPGRRRHRAPAGTRRETPADPGVPDRGGHAAGR